MGIFTKSKMETREEKKIVENKQHTPLTDERPRICCIDIEREILDNLTEEGYNIYPATLGDKIKVPNKQLHHKHEILLNFDFPSNIHEYDIIIIDLENANEIIYRPEDHVRNNYTGKSAVSLVSSFPETVFNPKPLSSQLLNKWLSEIGSRPHLIITFTTGDYEIEYEMIEVKDGYSRQKGSEKCDIYSFAGFVPLSAPKFGKEMNVCNIPEDFKNLLTKSIENSNYNQTFDHPTIWENNERILDPRYIPLIKNSSGDIVSICDEKDNSLNFYLPQINNKSEFLSKFLKTIAPSILPELFPFSTTFNWKENQDYWLPNHDKLLEEKNKIISEYEKKIADKDVEINKNIENFTFLHELVYETGDKLVNATIEFLKWLDFKKVINADDLKKDGQVLEEDIQIEFEKGLLIIECKGIGGTSTDSDCSQISKIKHRRSKQRNKFDVFALYIVNHQRYLPPLQRINPPFTENQIHDSISDERGLLSTWQLFNLYYEIENGIITKEEAKDAITKFGLIAFKPANLTFIDEPKEILKNEKVCIVNIDEILLKIGDELLIEKNGQFTKSIIEGIHADDKPLKECSNGEIGLMLSIPIKAKSKIWKKNH